MIFLNIGDGYSSGCCTGSVYFYACEDPKYANTAGYVEHPDSRSGSFIEQLAEMYKARTITIARHRTTVEEIIDNADEIINLTKLYNDEIIAFVGIPDLYSTVAEIDDNTEEYLLLDGLDRTSLSEEDYINLCEQRHSQDILLKISNIENFLNQISTHVKKIILYRTTSSAFEIKIPDNCSFIEDSVIELLQSSSNYKRNYYDKTSYKIIVKKMLKEFT